MRVLIFSVAIALLGAAYGDEIPSEDNVLVLSKANFDSVVSSSDFVLVEFCKSILFLLFVFLVPFSTFQFIL